jgi:hypothetical protein
VLHPVALVLLVSIPFPEDALLPKFAGAVSVLSDVSSELLSTIPLTFAPGELPIWYRITVRLGTFVMFPVQFWLRN